MIKLRKINSDQSLQDVSFELSIFPDQTSQVWKVQLPICSVSQTFQILWLFESESELFHVLQLARLLQKDFSGQVRLNIPYLPYARQDKEIQNQSTWALHLFADLLKTAGFSEITTFDQHSSLYFKSESAQKFHESVFIHDVVCFPDKGARARYPHLFKHPYVYFDKVRNQSTGVIEGLALQDNSLDLRDKKILIVDDLCDGGGTFIQAAQQLNKKSPSQVDLCVSHGLFTKGLEALYQAGIKKVYTTNSLLRNPEGFSVWN